jgi:hypothetical protein
VPSDVKPEAQAVEKRPRAQDSRESECAHEVGQRVRWIGHDQDDRFRYRPQDLGKDLPVDSNVRLEQLEPACRIVAICRPAGFFIHADGDHDECRAGQVRVISVADLDDRRERRAVLQIGHHGLCPLTVSVHHNNFARDAAQYAG